LRGPRLPVVAMIIFFLAMESPVDVKPLSTL